MSTPRIFQDCRLHAGETVRLHEQASHHVLTVLRLKPDAALTLFNGRGGEFVARLLGAEKRRAVVKLESFVEVERESPVTITLFQGISKGTRMDWAVQKAVEAGVHTIVPLMTEHCPVSLNQQQRRKKQAHWQAIVEQACQQCGRNRVPAVALPLSFDAALTQATADVGSANLVLSHRGDRHLSHWIADKPAPARVNIFIGNEGGFSDAEIERAIMTQCQIVKLGPRILRTETAALAAITGLQYAWGDY